MAESYLTGRRVFYALLVLALVVALAPTTFAVKPDKTRTFNRCMLTCEELKITCDTNCEIDCNSLFPSDPNGVPLDPNGLDECLGACQNECADFMRNCKAACKFEFTGKTPNVP